MSQYPRDMVRRFSYSSVLLLVGLIGCVGCRASDGSQSLATDVGPEKSILLIGIDTSGSAQSSHSSIFGTAKDVIMTLPQNQVIYMYRFDSAPAEVFSDIAPSGEEEIAALLNKVLSHKEPKLGTNLAKLFQLMDRQIRESTTKAKVLIFTDCGTEEMQNVDLDLCKAITSKWKADNLISSIEFHGVKDGFREELRRLVQIDPQSLKFLN